MGNKIRIEINDDARVLNNLYKRIDRELYELVWLVYGNGMKLDLLY